MVWGPHGWCQSRWFFGNMRELLTKKHPIYLHSKAGRKKVLNKAHNIWSKCDFCSQTFPFCLSLLCLSRPLLCPDRVHAEILVHPPLHRSHSWKHQSWRLLQSGRSKLCHPRSQICSQHRWYFHMQQILQLTFLIQLMTETTSSMKVSSRSIGRLAIA